MNYSYLYPCMVSMKIFLLSVHTPLTGYGWYTSVECCIFSVVGLKLGQPEHWPNMQATLATALPSWGPAPSEGYCPDS